jgi:cysteinyl-tRNA synthetase
MTIYLYNTLSRKKEIFETVEPNKVKMYVCGPTVYDASHIGHARSVVVFDVLVRYLRARGFEVVYVRNFTDVDDKIIAKANQTGMSCRDVAEKYIQEFYADMDALKIERATFEPRATEYIDEIIRIVQMLIEKGHAYPLDGDVYFAVESFSGYGKLSGRKLDDMAAGARVDVDIRKRNPFDFALWKASKPGEPEWDSPWGKGRPGWHIECSAMSSALLGETIDIHGGGMDLTFPHHENEVAQSEAAFGKTFVKYWVHNGFVNINQEKMSKSLGNFLLIRDVLKSYHPEVIRLFLLSSHYRSPIDFNDKIMDDCSTALDKVYTLLVRLEEHLGKSPVPSRSGELWEHFCEAMDDDLNTARGIGLVFESVRAFNRLLDESDGAFSSDLQQIFLTAWSDLQKISRILGVFGETPAQYAADRKSLGLQKTAVDPFWIEKMIADRTAARKSREWRKADDIRKHLEAVNVIIEDRPDGTLWRMA